MKKFIFMIVSLFFLIAIIPISNGMAQDPVKWSAPMNDYPTQWNPTAAPPSYHNPYGYTYPYAGYGYGPYGNQSQGAYQGNYYGGQAGNPYYGYYGQ